MTTAARSDARPYHHGALRASLLARAAEVVAEEGLEALTLRGIARDLGVSHGAPNRHFRTREDLLAALAEEAATQACEATLSAMAEVSDDPWMRLNAMGRGYLKWALENRPLFRVFTHPDVSRFADESLVTRMQELDGLVAETVRETQATGRHPNVHPELLNLYTSAVPWGIAMIVDHPGYEASRLNMDIDEAVAQLIELVVPIAGR